MSTTRHFTFRLLALSLLGQAAAFAGETIEPAKIAVEPKAVTLEQARRPLCFLGGAVCFDVEERARFEARENNFDFDNSRDNPTDDSWLLQRFRIGVAVQPASWLQFYAQGQDAREYHSDRPDTAGVLGAEGDDTMDLRQAYVRIGDPKLFPLTLFVGRQLLAYGDERLVGTSDWSNFSRSFDAVRLRFEQPQYWVEAFTSSVVTITRNQFNHSDLFNGNENRRELIFSGLYFSTSVVPATTLDLYAFSLNQRNGNSSNLEGNLALPPAGAWLDQGGDPSRRTDFFTLGARIKGDPKKLGGLEYDAEVAAQTGRVAGLDLDTFAAHAGVGYNFYHAWSQPRIYAEYAYATGDTDPTDGDNNTFQNLFPTNHRYYGYMDLFAWQNIHNPAISLSCTPLPRLTVRVDGHAFFLATNEDASYRPNGLIRNRPLARDADTYQGAELDIVARYKAFEFLTLEAGYAHFFDGDTFQATGRNDDADFGYLMTTIAF